MNEDARDQTKTCLVTGGIKSGKSDYALRLAMERRQGGRAFFLATAQALDPEMATRIREHRKRRPSYFETIEEPIRLPERLEQISQVAAVVVIDCLTLWLSNLICSNELNLDDAAIMERAEDLAKVLRASSSYSILVSNEVGWGIIPENPLGRRFQNLLGRINQKIAATVDEVILMVAGIPLRVK